MREELLEKKLQKKLAKAYGTKLRVKVQNESIRVSGQLDRWEDIITACSMCAVKNSRLHVVNEIVLEGIEIPRMRVPKVQSLELDGQKPDVLIIGGGISGASIARELSRFKLDILLVEKESDLAMQASGRNDGEVHPGVDLNKGSKKQHYVLLGNQEFAIVCRNLSVPFERCGQYVGFLKGWQYPFVWLYAMHKKYICGVKDTRLVRKKELRACEPELNKEFAFAMYNPSAGCVCPYGLTIAYGENAVENGANISLNTAVLDMKVEQGRITEVVTNKGVLHPGLVINAAGTFAEEIAKMADDHFYSIHPRRGTNSIMDKKTAHLVQSIASVKMLSKSTAHSKGGGILHTVHGNLLVGPNAVETYEKENFATDAASIAEVFKKQKMTAEGLTERDIITYFTGVRAATFEEDFVIEPGRRTKNLIHCAGIQSPGLTTAPVVAKDAAKMAVTELKKTRQVEPNEAFWPKRKANPVLRNMSAEERSALIRKNPDYGVIVCRCEEVSKGEIIDALHSPIPVYTVDGIKKRVRPGMGRCQGGFCMPLVTQIISEQAGIPLEEVRKANEASVITYGETKGVRK